MGVFEIILYLLGFALLILLLRKTDLKDLYLKIFLGVSLVLIILDIILGIYRWYIIILYISYALIAFLVIYKLLKKVYLKRITIIAVIVLLIALSFPLAFPIPSMPLIEGEETVGTMSMVLTDDSRIEQYNDSQELRRFKVQFWYPTDDIDGLEKEKWLVEGTDIAKGLCMDNGLPGFFMNQLEVVESNSYKNAPIKQPTTSYPVIIISHGWSGFRNLHTDLAEELASHGFFVVSIDHTYGSIATVFDENDIEYINRDALPVEFEDPTFLDYANVLVNTYAGDVIETMDQLEDLNGTTFNNWLDLNHIGLLGHSTGGGGDVTVALQDNRVTSLFGLDAWVQPIDEELIDNGLNIPAVFLRSEAWEDADNNYNLYNVVDNNSLYSILYQIDGTRHTDFTMSYMFSTATGLIGLTGSVETDYLNHIIETFIVNFFVNTLKEETLINQDISQWVEVKRINIYELQERED